VNPDTASGVFSHNRGVYFFRHLALCLAVLLAATIPIALVVPHSLSRDK